MGLNLLSSSSRVETPFIIATIAGVTFGAYSKESKNVINSSGVYKKVLTKYPNFMDSLTITKINGALNTYTLTMRYMITENDDPNLLEKVFSKAKDDRTITLSYGDLSIPSYVYKEEQALITDIRSNIDTNSSCITYTISCISKALNMNAGNYNFPKVHAKPSDIIKKYLYDARYGLLEIFYGMSDKEKVLAQGLIASDDRAVDIEAKKNTSLLKYLEYLVSCMSNISDSPNSILRNNKYVLTVYDDITNIWGGPYFKVNKMSTTITSDSLDTYEIDIGYPGQNKVINFNVDDNQAYSILYDYSGKINQSDHVYRINNNGEITYDYSPTLSNSSELLRTTEADKGWWTTVTQYPITATLTIQGLVRPSILMTYIKLNVLFFGRKHISSGYYIITKQVDQINAAGYKTTLSLTRIGAAD